MQRNTPANPTIELFNRAENAFDRCDTDAFHLAAVKTLFREVIGQLQRALDTAKSKDNYYYLSCSYRELAWMALQSGDLQSATLYFNELLSSVHLGRGAAATDWAVTFHYNMLLQSVQALCNALIEQTKVQRESGKVPANEQDGFLNTVKRHLENRDTASCMNLISDKHVSQNLNSLFAHRFASSCPSFTTAARSPESVSQVRRLVS